MTDFFRDDFTGSGDLSTHNPTTGGAYSAPYGGSLTTMTLTGSGKENNNSGQYARSAVSGSPGTSYVMSATFDIVANAGGASIFWDFAAVKNSNGAYLVELRVGYSVGAGVWRMFPYVGNSANSQLYGSTVNSPAGLNTAVGASNTMTAEVTPSGTVFKINGTTVATTSQKPDIAPESVEFNLISTSSGTVNGDFDSLSLSSLSSTTNLTLTATASGAATVTTSVTEAPPPPTIDTTDRAYVAIRNDHDDATLVLSQAEAGEGYEAEQTQTAVRDDEFHSTDTTEQTMTGTWTAPRTINHFSIHGHGLYGAQVRFQIGSYDSGTIDVADFTSPAIVVDDYLTSEGSSFPYAHEMSFWLDFPEQTDDQYIITFSGTPRDYAYFWASRIWVARAHWFEHTATFGHQWWMESLSKGGRTFGGSKRGNRLPGWRRQSFDLNAVRDAEGAVHEEMQRRCDTVADMVFNPFAGEGTRREVVCVFAGTLSAISPLSRNMARIATKVQLEEN